MTGTDTVISVEKLSKSYLVGHETARGAGYQTLRETITRSVRSFGRTAVDMARGRQIIQGDEIEEFWALKDVSFKIKRGEAVGIIGRNGAGKSTLLKILSRITEPTSGRIVIRGRVASLLEVGTGFHQELTGRENIFLNGAILGMTRREIKAKFDEIVEFSGVERFLDTPVKRYSSGMYVRLAFAVAAHLEPEILIIDEVLAVGDLGFQRKCLGKMRDVAEAGRTVLFVSHNLTAIVGLTDQAILLEQGQVMTTGPSKEVVSLYLHSTNEKRRASGDYSIYRRAHRLEGHVEIRSIRVCEQEPGTLTVGVCDHVSIDLELDVRRAVEQAIIVISVLNEQLEIIATVISTDFGFNIVLGVGVHTIRCDIPALPLIPGDYQLNVAVAESAGVLSWDVLESVPGFRIEGGQNTAWLQASDRPGVLLIDNTEWAELR
ncbi:MAG: ABC transporter ATP-binding protein [Rhizomicrobium sp.]